MLDYIIENRGAIAHLYCAVILGIVCSNMSTSKCWRGKIIKYSMSTMVLSCIILASPAILRLF